MIARKHPPGLLLAFIFCGAIVGETLSLSLVVTTFGPAAVGKLYIVNAGLLFLLPLFFYRLIDRCNRGKLLSRLLLGTVLILTCLFILLKIPSGASGLTHWVTLLLYPVAYMSKTVLFLTYWTLLNDIYSIREAKLGFPVISAWGFGGALCGVIAARLLVAFVSTQEVIILWGGIYYVAWRYSRSIGSKYVTRLIPSEAILTDAAAIRVTDTSPPLKLVRVLAVFYFGIFLTVFLQDFVFWKNCDAWFVTPEKVASFQLTFYFMHASMTLVLLRYALPHLIRKIGFTRILFGLPLLFFAGGWLLFPVYLHDSSSLKFSVLTGVQFLRHVLFELTFAPSYQMFFAAIVKEQRGRAKTLLEGVVKPAAILTSGAIIVGKSTAADSVLMPVIAGGGMVLCTVILLLRRTYRAAMIREPVVPVHIDDIIEEAGEREDIELYTTVEKYASAKEQDIRAVAIHLLERSGTPQALNVLIQLYYRERSVRLQEMTARSLSAFYGYSTRPFMEKLLTNKSRRVRANAVCALNNMNCTWKRYLRDLVGPMLFENDLRIQLEAARFLWSNGTAHEKNTVMHFSRSLLESAQAHRRSAGIFLIGSIRSQGWETHLLDALRNGSMQVSLKSMEMLFENASDDARVKAIFTIEPLSREHISAAGKIMREAGSGVWNALVSALPRITNRRLLFEIAECLTKITETDPRFGKANRIPGETGTALKRWITGELERIYLDACCFYCMRGKDTQVSSWTILEEALREKQLRTCSWAISVMILLDHKGRIGWRSPGMSIRECSVRNDMIEVMESIPGDEIAALVLPLLKQESWDDLVKKGKMYFHLTTPSCDPGIARFLRSENRLIALCALFIVKENGHAYGRNGSIEEALGNMKHDADMRASSAALELLDWKNGRKIDRSEAFELLERVLFLKHTALFHRIGAERLLRIAETAHCVEYDAGEVISNQGRMSDQLFIVKTGRVRVEKRSENGNIPVAYIGKGETYGEVGLFAKTARKSTAIADEKSELFVIKGTDMRRLLRDIPDMAFGLLEAISMRLLKSGGEVENLDEHEDR